jgi:tetratricopeptide (TPR) repeat protein
LVASQVACQSGFPTCNAHLSPKKVLLTHHLVSPVRKWLVVNFRQMAITDSQTEHVSEIEAALLDAELFMKYQSTDRAIKRLKTALEMNGRSVKLRERLREICAAHKQGEEAARQCLALASIYIEREDFDTAHDRLLEAKQLDARINIAKGLEAIRRARRPDLKPTPAPEANFERKHFTLAGDLSAVSVFDAIQVIENARLNGVLTLNGPNHEGQVKFNDGRIVDALCDGEFGDLGFQRVVEITNGTFEFQKSSEQFPTRIQALSNTNLILDTLRLLDERKQ